MSEPLPDPRIDAIDDESDSSDEEDDDLFATIESEKKREKLDEKSEKSCQIKSSNKASKKSRKRIESKDFVCNECQPIRCFKRSKVLDSHKELVHKALCECGSVCLWCAKLFYSQNQLLVHQKLYSHDKPLH